MEPLIDIGARPSSRPHRGAVPRTWRRREMSYRSASPYKDGSRRLRSGDFPAGLERALQLPRPRETCSSARPRRPRRGGEGVGVTCYVQGSVHRALRARAGRVDRAARSRDHRRGGAGPGDATTPPRSTGRSWGSPARRRPHRRRRHRALPIGMGTGGSRVAANAGPPGRNDREAASRSARGGQCSMRARRRPHRGGPSVRRPRSRPLPHPRPAGPRGDARRRCEDNGAGFQHCGTLPGRRDVGVRRRGRGRRGRPRRAPSSCRLFGRSRQRTRHHPAIVGGRSRAGPRRHRRGPRGRSSSTTVRAARTGSLMDYRI